MQGEVVVRAATEGDWAARAELVRHSITEHDFEAFLMFFFQELTLQVCVLAGAVLFIFVGASPAACALLLPTAAAGVALGVTLTHRARAASCGRRLRSEVGGFVAEYRGPPDAGPRAPAARVLLRPAAPPAPGARLVGTVSLAACWGPRRRGWLHALAVAPRWRRRGVGAALEAACRAHAARAGLQSLEAAASQLQDAARALLHAAGWETRGSYHRPVLGAALTLPMTQLGVELPPA